MAERATAGDTRFAALLRFWRERVLLTQAQLAVRAGLGVRTIRRMESGSLRRPRPDSVRLLADALDLTVGERADLVAAASGNGSSPYERPRQLPAPPEAFTGRAVELADLDRFADVAAVVIVAIDGMAGIGKTALALHASHRLAPRFHDGQLFIDLHGHTRGVAPVSPSDALDRMLRAFGVPEAGIPHELDERAGLLRTILAGRRVLVVLDNAGSEAQVRPLLPGMAGCLVLITSRRRLAGLENTQTISLDVLPAGDALTLLARSSDTGESASALAEIVELCGRLPLAISIAAARLRNHPTWTPAYLAERLRDHRHRLAELDAGDRSITAAIDLSYQHLASDQQRGFSLLGLHPGAEIGTYAAAAVTDTTVMRAGRLLDDLTAAHLLTEHTPGRYRFHDLVRAHAAAMAQRTESEPDRRVALTRLLDHYTHAASVAMDLVYPHLADERPRVPRPHTPVPVLDGESAGRTWLDTELSNLLAAGSHAGEQGWDSHTLRLSATLDYHLRFRGYWAGARVLHVHALGLARDTGERASEAQALLRLARIDRLVGHYDRATDQYQRALKLAREIRNRVLELSALRDLGVIHRQRNPDHLAADHFRQVLGIAREIGHHPGELEALHSLGHILNVQGRYDLAADHFQQMLEIARRIGHSAFELAALCGLGDVDTKLGRYDLAADHFERVLEIARRIGHRFGELEALRGLADIHRGRGCYNLAADHYWRSLAIAREIDSRNGQFEALHGLGHLNQATGKPTEALAHHEAALDIARELEQRHDEARAHDGIAHAHAALGNSDLARNHWQQALAIFTDLDTPEANEIRTHLSGPGIQERPASR